jgi:hypothetical protein
VQNFAGGGVRLKAGPQVALVLSRTVQLLLVHVGAVTNVLELFAT